MCMSCIAHSAAALPQAPHVGPAAAPRRHSLPHSSQKQSSVFFSSPHSNVHQMNCTGDSTLPRPKHQPPECGGRGNLDSLIHNGSSHLSLGLQPHGHPKSGYIIGFLPASRVELFFTATLLRLTQESGYVLLQEDTY